MENAGCPVVAGDSQIRECKILRKPSDEDEEDGTHLTSTDEAIKKRDPLVFDMYRHWEATSEDIWQLRLAKFLGKASGASVAPRCATTSTDRPAILVLLNVHSSASGKISKRQVQSNCSMLLP
jgi:hypothetical protein